MLLKNVANVVVVLLNSAWSENNRRELFCIPPPFKSLSLACLFIDGHRKTLNLPFISVARK
jgi:hypothetical protein